jgi:hypothetical protein
MLLLYIVKNIYNLLGGKMSKPINYLIPGTTLNQTVLDSAANSAIQGYKESAIQKISQCGLSQKQMEKVTKIINETPSSNVSTTGLEALKKRILAGLCIFPNADKPIPLSNVGKSISIPNADKPISPVSTDYFFHMDKLPSDMVFEICKQCVLGGNAASVGAFGMTSKTWYQKIINPNFEGSIVPRFSFKEWCPRLKILNKSEFNACDQLPINHFSCIEAYQALVAPEVLDEEGRGHADILFFVMPKGLTIKSLLSMAKECGMSVSISAMDREAVQELDSYAHPVDCPYGVLIVDDFYLKSCVEESEKLGELADQLNCKLPTLEELLAAYIFKYKTTGKYPSSAIWGCTQTLAGGDPASQLGISLITEFSPLGEVESYHLQITRCNRPRYLGNAGFSGVKTFS